MGSGIGCALFNDQASASDKAWAVAADIGRGLTLTGAGFGARAVAKGVGKAISRAARTNRVAAKGEVSTKSNLKLGQQMHKAYKAELHNPAKGLYKEFTGVKGIRPDFVDFNKRIIYELKPNNPRQIKAGWNQLNKYKSAFESQYGGTWKIVLDLY